MNEYIVLDKSYLQGAPGDELRTLAETRRLLVSAALFYELLTTSPEVRRKCFRRLPQIRNPVVLFEHIGVLLRREVDTGSPAGRPSENSLDFPFEFNRGLVTDSYSLPEEALRVLKEQTADVEGDIDRLIAYSETIGQLFPGLLMGTATTVCELRRDAYATICDLSWIRQFYEDISANESDYPFPRIHHAHFSWTHIRWLQVNLLFALDLHIRHAGRLRRSLTRALRERLEHDVHDAQILALGVLEGELATRESKLQEWHLLLQSGNVEQPGHAAD